MTSENKKQEHTPGPWFYGKYWERVTRSETSDGSDSICHVYQSPNQEADVRLIAATPDLLEVCQQALSYIAAFDDDHDDHKAMLDQLESAIAKARGN